MKPVQCVITDATTIKRLRRVADRRGHKKLTRTVRELALERLNEIESSGDPHAIRNPQETTTRPPGSPAADLTPRLPVPANTAGALTKTRPSAG